MVQIKVPGSICELVESERNKQEETPPPAPATPQTPARTNIAQDGFPVVTPNEQLTRDQIRASILLEELQQEIDKRDNLRAYLRPQVLKGLEPEARDFYARRLRGHLLNIKAIEQEIERLDL